MDLLLIQKLSEEGEMEYQEDTLLQFVDSQYDQPAKDSSTLDVIGIKRCVSVPITC